MSLLKPCSAVPQLDGRIAYMDVGGTVSPPGAERVAFSNHRDRSRSWITVDTVGLTGLAVVSLKT